MNTTKLPQDTEAPAVGVPVERMVRPADPERAAYARWLADTHAPALRRIDSEGAHAAGYAAGVAACVAYVEKRRADFAHEHGLMDPETGAWEYGRGDSGELKRQYDCDLAEIADGLRALGPNAELTGPPGGTPGGSS